ncbi:hypothetical protein C8R43DRAFT_1130883 [Mycena crocata]|nr:hypothetical protein C8R43DRAFT_1130883 [Mycena crocata]
MATGVLVARPATESRDTPPAYEPGDHISDGDQGDEQSEDNFINDGDPYEGYQSDGMLSAEFTPPPSPVKSQVKKAAVNSPSPTPPATPVKSRAHRAAAKPPVTPSPKKSPTKSNNGSGNAVIELDSSSEEDLEAMDIDDSEFKKPAGVKPASLPPSLVTRSAASKRSLAGSGSPSQEQDGSASKRVKTNKRAANASDSQSSADVLSSQDISFNPFGSDPGMTKMMGAFLAFIKENPGVVTATADAVTSGRSERDPSAGPSTGRRIGGSNHVDHDDLALQERIRSSLESPLRLQEPATRFSPDWDPPDVADLLEEVEMKRRLQKAGTSSPKKPTASGPTKRKAPVSSKAEDVQSVQSKPSRAKASVKAATSKIEADDEQVEANPVKKGKGKVKGHALESGADDVPVHDSATHKGKGKAKAPADTNNEDKVQVQKKPKDLSAYLLVKKIPVVSDAVGDEDGKPPVTMAQYMRMARGETEPEEEIPESPVADNDEPPVFLEDLEAYKAFFDPKAKCGVFDVKIQDPTMRPHYVGLPPLPGGRMLLAAFDPERNSTDDVDYRTGGRVAFGEWVKVVPRMLASNSMGSMLFTEAGGRYINLSRCSPLGLSAHTSAGSSQTVRLQIGDKIAICVTPVCLTESCLFAPKAVGRGDRYRKWMMGITHDYDHERLVSMLSLVFGEPILYAQMVDKAISFQTMLSPANDSGRTPDGEFSHAVDIYFIYF